MSVQINESTKTVSEEAAAGAAVYSNFLLSIYDLCIGSKESGQI